MIINTNNNQPNSDTEYEKIIFDKFNDYDIYNSAITSGGSTDYFIHVNNGTSGISSTDFNWSTSNPDMEIQGDLKIKGVSVLETLQQIQDRLAILQPDPAKLEKFQALRTAYEHYKLLEKLLNEE
jgi:hypothetical protein